MLVDELPLAISWPFLQVPLFQYCPTSTSPSLNNVPLRPLLLLGVLGQKIRSSSDVLPGAIDRFSLTWPQAWLKLLLEGLMWEGPSEERGLRLHKIGVSPVEH